MDRDRVATQCPVGRVLFASLLFLAQGAEALMAVTGVMVALAAVERLCGNGRDNMLQCDGCMPEDVWGAA